jgi:phosphocarrier protein FPr
MVGVCGGIAGDPAAVPILIGMGVSELSVSLPAIPTVKAQIRALRLHACRALAERALAAESAEEVRALVSDPDLELTDSSTRAATRASTDKPEA